MRCLYPAFLIACGLFSVGIQTASSQDVPLAENPEQETQPRQIAPVMSYLYADWLTRPEREFEEQPDRVVAALKIPRGATIVDLGAGSGYFTWRLAKSVGPEGKVLAVDIQNGMLDLLKSNMEKRNIQNYEAILATETDLRLPQNQVDLVLLVDVYHELASPILTLQYLRRALKPDGRLVVVEYRKGVPGIPIHPLHKMTVEEVRNEVEPVGFDYKETMHFLPRQDIVIFTPDKE